MPPKIFQRSNAFETQRRFKSTKTALLKEGAATKNARRSVSTGENSKATAALMEKDIYYDIPPVEVPSHIQATIFKGKNKPPVLETVSMPTIQQETDVIVKVLKTTICGTDLHILGKFMRIRLKMRNLVHKSLFPSIPKLNVATVFYWLILGSNRF